MSRPPFPVPPGGPGLAPPPGYFVPRPPMPAPFPMQPYPPGAPVPMVGVPPMGQAPPRPMYPGAPMPGPPMTPGGVPPRNPGRQRTYPGTMARAGGPRAPRTPPPSMSMVHRSTSVYVGKIANSVDDGVMQSLLEACGGVKSWKRQEDPETKQPKGFGFCEFEDAEGVLRALRLLNNLALDGQELLVKCNTATQKYIEAYESEKEAREAEKQEEKEEGEAPGNADEDRDNEVLEKIMAIVSDREDKIKKHKADQERAAEVLNALAVAKPDSATGSRDREDRERNDHRGRSKERTMEREFDRKRQQERREQEAKQREEDRAYDKKLQEWDRQER
ncbi:unnamed protein product [Ostreobium quekettii]|uniref:RRM domain-containing protein n=1 Tax=Ostreobium quekettii TaxID=121088 RepID=A0A8S1JHJ3_9CHLO|nr:unnamed protein product [Ostreobium quekettii]